MPNCSPLMPMTRAIGSSSRADPQATADRLLRKFLSSADDILLMGMDGVIDVNRPPKSSAVCKSLDEGDSHLVEMAGFYWDGDGELSSLDIAITITEDGAGRPLTERVNERRRGAEDGLSGPAHGPLAVTRSSFGRGRTTSRSRPERYRQVACLGLGKPSQLRRATPDWRLTQVVNTRS